MKLYIDADACPVTDIAVGIAKRRGIECILTCDDAHEVSVDGVTRVTVDTGRDSADLKIVSMIAPGDIVVTQDYGLAALCLAKNAFPINQNGLIFTKDNIDSLLFSRYASAKERMSGNRIKGPKKRTRKLDEEFARAFILLIRKENDKNA